MCGSEDLEELREGEQTTTKFLRICLHTILPRVSPPPLPLSLFNKLQSNVRLAALLNIPITTQTLLMCLLGRAMSNDAMPGAAHPHVGKRVAPK